MVNIEDIRQGDIITATDKNGSYIRGKVDDVGLEENYLVIQFLEDGFYADHDLFTFSDLERTLTIKDVLDQFDIELTEAEIAKILQEALKEALKEQ